MAALKRAFLSGNQLSFLPPNVFDFNTALEEVELANNQLTSLPDGLFQHTAVLSSVFLNNNNLTSLPSSLFSINNNVTVLFECFVSLFHFMIF